MKNTKGPRAGFNPKTASTTQMQGKPPVRATGSNAFPDAQKQVTQPPQPFANPQGTVQLPTKASYDSHKLVKTSMGGVKGLPPGGPVGQTKPINQSGQVFGAKGISHPRKVGAQNIGKSRRSASFYGEN